ncbi:MAG: sugar phosphate isomerase/epimerase [Chloroflexota bacterium]|nr:sugar phosphate isomerase/epimerase [Chloroflexota bacterium]
MKIAYAFRRTTVYPYTAGFYGPGGWGLPDEPALTTFLKKINEIGFDGIELGFEVFGGHDATKESTTELKTRLEDAGAPCVAIRAGGVLCTPVVGEQNRDRLLKSIDIAGWLGIDIVNSALSGPSRNKTLGDNLPGKPIQQGSSQLASYQDFERTAGILHEAGVRAGDAGLNVTVEVHQHSIADTSTSTLKLLEMTNSDHVFANPDLGNILWHYDEPEQSSEEAILALAPHSKYWHCKTLQRVHVPELDRAYFIRTALPDGDIDYRFAISAMLEAGYDGYFALEGTNTGDHLTKDAKSVAYVRQVVAEIEQGKPIL